MKLTHQMLHDAATNYGGWNKKQLAVLKVGWPAKKGWLSKLVGSEITDEDWNRLLSLRRPSKVKPVTINHNDLCPVCGSGLLVRVVRLVEMFHCNGCGSEIPVMAWESSDRVDKRLRRRVNKMQDTIDRLNDIAVNGYPEDEEQSVG